MIAYRAAWVLPIVTPPLQNASIIIDNGRIADVHPTGSGGAAAVRDLGDVAVLPALVNAHTHVELSWIRGLLPPSDTMPAWARRVIELRAARGRDPEEPMAAAVGEMLASGTGLVGDVTNTLASFAPLARGGMRGVVFLELLKFNAAAPNRLVADALEHISHLPPADDLVPALAAHAPYSVAPTLFRAVAEAARRWPDRPIAVHVGESAEEMEFLAHGTGEWRSVLEDVGAWDPDWQPPACGPVTYLDRHGFLGPRLLAVHCVQLARDELLLLRERGATVVTCPRSNEWTGAGVAPIDRFYASGVRIAVGTDSLGSVPDLNLFAELAMMRRLAPRVAARRLLESATMHGAAALGFGRRVGTIERGKDARLIAVSVPGDVTDVEEYLVSGIQPSQVHWLAQSPEP